MKMSINQPTEGPIDRSIRPIDDQSGMQARKQAKQASNQYLY